MTRMHQSRVILGLAGALALLQLAGCSTAPARTPPVEDRSVSRGAPPPRSESATPSGAVVTPAPDSEWTVTPMEPSGREGASPAYEGAPRSAPATATAGAASPAVVALLETAREQQSSDRLSEAAASLERAQRIEPRNPRIWYELAVVRFRQGQLPQAEQMALKSDALAAGDDALRARNWRLIALVRLKGGDRAGSEQARAKAEQLERY